ncbi:hypothetical protein LWI28_011979 [Acer negundo]|uniref:Uncharacterized protein n=1 Tax=Acer negundo TaxID=4023 RepID=A0AAD5J4V3_ACENE|nr:hypothetical protein LWI28_011979 [Acer negundo]
MEGLSFLSIIRCFIFYLSIELSLATLTINPRRFIGDGETFVSLSERFELGFFSPGNSKSRYLGIWHKECPGTVVWVANRNNPILDRRGVLCIGNYGNFILLNRTKDIIWSSDKSSRKIKNPVVHFLETGNLVLGESSFLISCKSYLWQSFDYPSDTLLPGMKLGRDLKTNPERYLMSWKSADDPSSGDFIFKLDIHVLPQISVYNGSMKISRSGLWNGVSFGGIPTISTSLLRQHLVHNEDEFYYMYEIDIPVIIKLNQAGEMQCLICSSGWDIMYTVPFDSCGMYGKCGANGVCSIDKTPICECLEGFVPQSLDNKTLPETCVRSSPFNCERVDRFIQLGGIKLPDLIEVSLIEGISLQECEAECLKNCSCRAYANSNVSKGGIGCLMWFGDLIDIRKLLKDVEGQDIYVRVPASEIGLEELQDTLFLVLSVILGMLMVFLSFCIAWKITKNGGNGIYSSLSDCLYV